MFLRPLATFFIQSVNYWVVLKNAINSVLIYDVDQTFIEDDLPRKLKCFICGERLDRLCLYYKHCKEICISLSTEEIKCPIGCGASNAVKNWNISEAIKQNCLPAQMIMSCPLASPSLSHLKKANYLFKICSGFISRSIFKARKKMHIKRFITSMSKGPKCDQLVLLMKKYIEKIYHKK